MSRQFHILAPIMDREGKGELQDIFREQSKNFNEQSMLHWKEYDSLRNKALEIQNYLDVRFVS